ncbi:hypothetical protein PCE1_002494 [Barthelona sp. PCE]
MSDSSTLTDGSEELVICPICKNEIENYDHFQCNTCERLVHTGCGVKEMLCDECFKQTLQPTSIHRRKSDRPTKIQKTGVTLDDFLQKEYGIGPMHNEYSDDAYDYVPEEEEEGKEIVDDDGCIACGGVGEVILCTRCAMPYHPTCVGLSDIPEQDWFCQSCENLIMLEKKRHSTEKYTKNMHFGSETVKKLASNEVMISIVLENFMSQIFEQKTFQKRKKTIRVQKKYAARRRAKKLTPPSNVLKPLFKTDFISYV